MLGRFKNISHYILQKYDDTGLKYQTAFQIDNFDWDQDIKNKNYFGYCEYHDIKNILNNILDIYQNYNNSEVDKFNSDVGIKYKEFIDLINESINSVSEIYN